MVFLVGMPGSGKSYWLDSFATAIQYQGLDLDEEIERKFQRKIARVFKNKEEEFRLEEKAMLKQLIETQVPQTIIATGGGTPAFFDNMQLMKKTGTVVYLKAEQDFIFNNLARNLNQRPFLPKTKNALINYIDNTLDHRSQFYEQADIILPVKYLNPEFFMDQVKPFLK